LLFFFVRLVRFVFKFLSCFSKLIQPAMTKIEVNGYTDLSGTVAYNQQAVARKSEEASAMTVPLQAGP